MTGDGLQMATPTLRQRQAAPVLDHLRPLGGSSGMAFCWEGSVLPLHEAESPATVGTRLRRRTGPIDKSSDLLKIPGMHGVGCGFVQDMTIEFSDLRDAVSQGAAFRYITTLQSVGEKGDKIFPSTYPVKAQQKCINYCIL